MKNLKIFPKMFLQIFSVIGVIVISIHLLVYYIFPKTYLDVRKDKINIKANEIADNMNGKSLDYVEQSLDFYSKSSDINAFVSSNGQNNEIQIKNIKDINLESSNNSLIIEERGVTLDNGEKAYIKFVSTADMKKDAKEISFKFLPYSLLISLVFSMLASLIYAKHIKNNIQEIKKVTDNMMLLDKNARLEYDCNDEVAQLKEQINNLYFTLLKSIDDLEHKNKEIIKLEKLKYEFFRGASHELKTPLASLKIILENMKYNIGKYKNRDQYIGECIDIVDSLTRNISQILSVYSIENLKDDEEVLNITDTLDNVIRKYEVLANQKKLIINNSIKDEKIYIGKTALNIILSNLVSNAVKYSEVCGNINIGSEDGWFYIKNSYGENKSQDEINLSEIEFDFNKANSNGLGLYIVNNLLKNYNIRYKALQNEGIFVFKIELANIE